MIILFQKNSFNALSLFNGSNLFKTFIKVDSEKQAKVYLGVPG